MLASSLSVYLGLLDLGVNPTVVKRVAEYRARDDQEGLGRLLSNAGVYYVVIGAIVSGVLLLLARYGIGFFHLPATSVDTARNLFTAAAVVALFSWPLGLELRCSRDCSDTTERHGRVRRGCRQSSGHGCRGRDARRPGDATGRLGLVTVIGGSVSTFLAWRCLRGVRTSWRHVSPRAIRSILSFGWMLFVMQLSVLVVQQETDRLLLATFVGVAAISLYEAAAKLSGLVNQMSALPCPHLFRRRLSLTRRSALTRCALCSCGDEVHGRLCCADNDRPHDPRAASSEHVAWPCLRGPDARRAGTARPMALLPHLAVAFPCS